MATIRAEAARVTKLLDDGSRWWDDDWALWQPDPDWPQPSVPDGWQQL